MRTSINEAGFNLFAKAQDRGHLVQFYNSDHYLYDTVTRFVGAGIAGGEGVIVIATASHLEGLQARLVRNSFDIERARKTGQLTWLDADETLAAFMPDGRLDADLFFATIAPVVERSAGVRSGVVRAYGEMVDVLCSRGDHGTAIELEHLWNQLIATRSLALLCGYSARNFADAQHTQRFRNVCEAHTCVMPAESFSALLTEDARRQEANQLEQHTRALEVEVEHRKAIELALRRRHEVHALAARKADALARQLSLVEQVPRQLIEDLLEVVCMLSNRAGSMFAMPSARDDD